MALDIGRRVALGEPQTLCLGQGIGIRHTLLGHRRQDEIGGSVDDAHHPPDAFAGQGLPQGSDEGNRTRHGRLVQEVDTRGDRRIRQRGAVGRDQLLVRRHHRAPRRQRRFDKVPGRIDAADQLHHHVHVGVGHEALGVTREEIRGYSGAGLGGIGDGHADELETDTRPGGDGIALVHQQGDERAPPTFPAPRTATRTGWSTVSEEPLDCLACTFGTMRSRYRPFRWRPVERPAQPTMPDQPSRRTRSSSVSRRTTTRAAPSATKTTAGRGTLL